MKIVQLISGGFDSMGQALLLQNAGWEIYPLYVNYRLTGGKIEKEIRAIEAVGAIRGWQPLQIIKHRIKKKLPDKSINPEYKFRNTALCRIAGGYAQRVGAEHVAIGTAYMEDQLDVYTYPPEDSKPEFLQEALPEGVQVHVLNMYKTEILCALPPDERYLMFNSTSCHLWYKTECGQCYSCTERHAAFIVVMGFDHTDYLDDPKSAISWLESWVMERKKFNRYLEKQNEQD